MMQVNTYSPNFTSRNSAVKQADKICRMVKNEFPSISSSRIPARCMADKKYYKFRNLFLRTEEKLKNFVRVFTSNSEEKNEHYMFLTETVKNSKVANCGELAKLAHLICSVNGIKSYPITIDIANKKDKDNNYNLHAVLAVPTKKDDFGFNKMSKEKDLIIIDPWLGFADYAQNIEQKYRSLFPSCFNLTGLKAGEEFYIRPSESMKFEEEEFTNLKEIYPEFIIKK